MYKMFQSMLAAILILALLISGSACGMGDSTSSSVNTPTNTTVISDKKGPSLDIIVEKVFPKLGFRFLIVLTDENGAFLMPVGKIDAKAWIQTKNVVPAKKEVMIYEWQGIELPPEGYMKVTGPPEVEGIPLVLEWGEFHLISDEGINIEEDAMCTVGVTLTMPDGTEFTAEEENISTLIRFTCC